MISTFFYIVVILLQKCCTQLVAGRVYYIKSSTRTPCLEEPCLTLFQFATYTEDYLEPNMSLIFLPGYHSLGVRLSIHAVSKLSMHSNSTLLPSPTIFCQEQEGVIFSSIDDVYIGHLKFIGCRGHKVISVNTFMLECATFMNHTEAVLQFLSSNTNTVRCSVSSNSGGSNWRLIRGVIGGVLYSSQTTISIVNSVFEGNEGYCGGAIYIKSDVYMVITGSNFSRNRAMLSGGVLHVEGRGIYTINIFVASSIFSDNSAETFGGGMAVHYSNGHNITLSGIEFLRNKAQLGGAIFLYSVKPIFISSSRFVANIAANGGAMASFAGSNVTVEGGTIESNEARIGVIYAATGTSIKIFNAFISSNAVNRAVVYILQSVGYLSDITFTDNTGSVFVYFSNLTFSGTVSMTSGSPQLKFTNTQEERTLKTFPEGGAVTAVQASVAIEGVYSLYSNYAESGGAF